MVFVPSFSSIPTNASVSGNFYDMKKLVHFDITIGVPTNLTIFQVKVEIDKKPKSGSSHRAYDLTTDLETVGSTNSKYLQYTFSKSNYNFLDLQEYKILYSVIFVNSTTKEIVGTASYIQTFKYYETPVTLNDFAVVDNVAAGSTISVTGLILSHGGLTPNVDPIDPSSIIFSFQDAEESGDVIYNEANDPYMVKLDYQASGNYTLPANTLTDGGIYTIQADALWDAGYSTNVYSSKNVYVLSRPVISSITKKSLSVYNSTDTVITINVNKETRTLASNNIWFEFYNTSDVLVAKIGGEAGLSLINTAASNEYTFKLSEIEVVASGGIKNGVNYKVKAKTLTTGPVDILNNVQYRSSDPIDVSFDLTQPTITNVSVNDLYVKNTTTKIATIDVKNDPYQLYAPADIKFIFYTSTTTGGVVVDTVVAETSAFTFVNLVSGVGSKSYDIKLSDVTSGLLDNGVEYKVKASVSLTNHAAGAESRLSDSQPITFSNVKPVINSISAYDLQDDGGNDGSYEGSTDVDSSDQIVASVYVDRAAYKLLAPHSINFVFYTSTTTNGDVVDTEVARTDTYTFVNNSITASYTYNIKLNEIVLSSGESALTNGTAYKVKSNVTLTDHVGNEIDRLSDDATDVTFSQNIAPIVALAITTDADSTSAGEPKIGISGSFMKTAQFNVNKYSGKQLDAASTLFKLEISLNNSSDWVLVKKAALKHKLANETVAECRARIRPLVDNKVDGKYNNIVGSLIGTSQEPLMFYIPQLQEGNNVAFTEVDSVRVRVTIIDGGELWGSISYEVSTISNSLQIVNKIEDYDFENGTDAEPWNSQYRAYYDSAASLLHVDVNGSIVSTNKSNVISSSNSIITEKNNGWHVLNGATGTSGASTGVLPKVNLYYYGNAVPVAQQTVSNSLKVNQINGLGAYVVIDQQQGALEYPFFNIYTTPTASGNKAAWYKSRLLYSSVSGNTVLNSSRAGLTLLYTGTDNASFHPEIPSSRRVKMEVNAEYSDTFGNYDNELINLVSVQTSSNASTSQAGSFNFILSEAGLATSSSVLSSLVMRFTSKFAINIPVNWKSIYAHSVKVGYKYSNDDEYSVNTFKYDNAVSSQYVSLYVDPLAGTTLYYSVTYVINNPNIGGGGSNQLEGVTVEKNVPNKFFPVNSSYTVTNEAYKTFNTASVSEISFDLALTTEGIAERIDGVNVYFTSPNTTTGSNISKVRIGSYTTSGEQTISLLSATGGVLRVMNDSGSIVDSVSLWGDYDVANISFEAFRDARVNSATASYKTTHYKESGSNDFSTPILNVPVLTKPSADLAVNNVFKLSGGVINTNLGADSHFIEWPIANDANGVPFTYDLTMTSVSVNQSNSNLSGPKNVLDLDLTTPTEYTVTIRKIFNGLGIQRELSLVDTIKFHTITVDTSTANVAVNHPSDTTRVNLSWVEPVVSGNSVTVTNGVVSSESASFANNVSSHNIQYKIGASSTMTRLVTGGGLIERIVSPDTKKQYTLPIQTLATLYKFYMYVEAQIKYTINDVVSSTKSIPVSLPLTPETSSSQYIVSTIPSILIPNDAPVLIQGQPNPTLLLNLNAKGLEDEGFISVFVILTQDGTPEKPQGEQALLVFPDSGSPTFNYLNSIQGAGSDEGDIRLAGGESATSIPRDLSSTVISGHAHNYTLTIGSKGTDGRYGLSTLVMPSSVNSDFSESGAVGSANYNPVNYMVIATTRRGSDVQVGTFRYEKVPAVSDVTVTNTNGQYSVHFTLTGA